jgi:hypothetical protein
MDESWVLGLVVWNLRDVVESEVEAVEPFAYLNDVVGI